MGTLVSAECKMQNAEQRERFREEVSDMPPSKVLSAKCKRINAERLFNVYKKLPSARRDELQERVESQYIIKLKLLQRTTDGCPYDTAEKVAKYQLFLFKTLHAIANCAL